MYVKKIYQFLNSSIAVHRSHINDQNHYLLGLSLPPVKRLTSWLLFRCFIVFCHFLMWYPGSGGYLNVSIPDLCFLSYFHQQAKKRGQTFEGTNDNNSLTVYTE